MEAHRRVAAFAWQKRVISAGADALDVLADDIDPGVGQHLGALPAFDFGGTRRF